MAQWCVINQRSIRPAPAPPAVPPVVPEGAPPAPPAAEARIVALLAEDYDLLTLFDILDVHKLTASFCYGLTSRTGQDLITSALSLQTCLSGAEQFNFLYQVSEEQRRDQRERSFPKVDSS